MRSTIRRIAALQRTEKEQNYDTPLPTRVSSNATGQLAPIRPAMCPNQLNPNQPKYPGIRITTNGNQLVSYYTEARIADGGRILSDQHRQPRWVRCSKQSFAEGKLTVFGGSKLAVETEGEHAAQGGAIAFSVTGKRTVNFTSGQGIVYGIEQFYHAPGKCSTMVLEVSARALTRHALNVHCGHDDIYAALDTGWTILFAKDAQQAADQALILSTSERTEPEPRNQRPGWFLDLTIWNELSSCTKQS